MSLRDLPAVDKLLAEAADLVAAHGRPLTTDILREELAALRALPPADWPQPPGGLAAHLLGQARARLEALAAPSLPPVINATGVIIHTNLGRAPLSAQATAALVAAARSYTPLEFDLARGRRGARVGQAEALLARLTGAEAALVVNNNAAAVLLVLSTLARGKRVLISRSQLVEIGGGFRVPDVMRQSGARLVEVGTTNRTHLADFQAALDPAPALILRAHHSNFKIVGFTAEPTLAELASLGVPVFDDLGSGALLDTAAFGLAHEPMPQESLAAGAALVAFSGDKLLGGPQAGIIVGRADLVARVRRHPLARAVRADKLCLAALAATLLHYLHDQAATHIPVWRMIACPPAELEQIAHAWVAALGTGEVVPGESTVGGGSLPGETLPTRLVALSLPAPNALAARLRASHPPVIARVAEGRLLLDPRTVLPEQASALLRAVRAALADQGPGPHPHRSPP